MALFNVKAYPKIRYLYKEGDEYTAVTGGWGKGLTGTFHWSTGYPYYTNNLLAPTKNSDNMEIYHTSNSQNYTTDINTFKTIDVSSYSTLHISGTYYAFRTPCVQLVTTLDSDMYGWIERDVAMPDYVKFFGMTSLGMTAADNAPFEFTFDISSVTEPCYIVYYDSNGRSSEDVPYQPHSFVHKIWLE